MTLAPDTPPRTKVVIVDDHPMVAEGIEAILETYDDLQVIGRLCNGRELVEQVETLAPDVILLDLNMPEINGLSATEMVLEKCPDTRILILSMHDSAEYISTAMSHGARGYILKDVPTDEIRLAIEAVMRGETYMCTGASASLEPNTADGREPLTSREQTILLQLASGKSNKEVAATLDISVRTVETHRKNIKRKLGISSTAGLTRYAMEHGVLQGTGVDL
ncbi:response regulator transcription factor [Dinoroseobacter sp. PD6]|uniref:response regulator transcription factor n=1 Tax=Dinoroseobacter sp. PD6 TaxID=3028384 RepID=UPI00237A8B3B|nr:response regulator transcription factor [Dinoroseobacter sp. PD6]MDD9716407.1 response regulator transcription factor [Dinoroseobacter sp. PD6]